MGTLSQLQSLTTDKQIHAGILCVLEVFQDESFESWANNWLNGKDRSKQTAYNCSNPIHLQHMKNPYVHTPSYDAYCMLCAAAEGKGNEAIEQIGYMMDNYPEVDFVGVINNWIDSQES